MLYKFKIWFTDEDDVQRHFEIKPGQSFAIFHQAIQKAINFDGSFEGEFFVSDDQWRRKKAISNQTLANKLGNMDTIIKDAVFEPYQKFIYIADAEQDWELCCEMVGFGKADDKTDYPNLAKSAGNAPRQRPAAPIIDDATDDIDDLAAIFMKNAKLDLDSDIDNVDDDDTDEDEDKKDDMLDEEFGTDEGDLDGFGEPEDMS